MPKNELAEVMGNECIAVRVRLINRVISAIYDEALRPFGLRISQANILTAVARIGETQPAVVSRALQIEKSTLSRDLELMKQKGWLASDPPAGGRSQKICVTPQGVRLLVKIRPGWERAQADAQKIIGPDGEQALRRIAVRLGFGQTTS